MKVQVINKSQWELPKYETLFSAGMDVRGDFSRIKLVDGKPEKFFFDADVVGIGLMEDPNSKGVVDKEGNYTGERLMQLVLAKHEVAEWEEVEVLPETDRGEGGFGHTGK